MININDYLQELLDLVTPEIVIQIMEENGSKLYKKTKDRRTNQTCLWFKTICHGGDSHKLCFFTETKDFFCYTNCGRMNFFEGMKKILDATKPGEFKKVVDYVSKKVGKVKVNRNKVVGKVGNGEIRKEIMELEERSNIRKNKEKDKVKITTFFEEDILKFFEHDVFYEGWIDEGISIKSMEKYEICWYEFQKAIVIPHRDVDKNLVGIRRRSLLPENQKSSKYMPLYINQTLYDHPLGLNLYGLYQTKNQIKKKKKAIIFEGEKSILLSDTYYGDKTIGVSVCGFNISTFQMSQLLKMGVEEIIIGFDKDFDVTKIEEYKKDSSEYNRYCNYINKLKTISSRILPFCSVSLLIDKQEKLGKKDSPIDKGKETFEFLMDKRIKVLPNLGNKIFEV